jgi:hypothetical protein
MSDILNARDVADLQTVALGAMRFTCTIQRNSQTGKNTHGQPRPAIWQTHLTGVQCALVRGTLRGDSVGEQRDSRTNYVYGKPELHVPLDTDVKVTDRIIDLNFEDSGLPAEPTVSAYDVTQVVPTLTYLALSLESIS